MSFGSTTYGYDEYTPYQPQYDIEKNYNKPMRQKPKSVKARVSERLDKINRNRNSQNSNSFQNSNSVQNANISQNEKNMDIPCDCPDCMPSNLQHHSVEYKKGLLCQLTSQDLMILFIIFIVVVLVYSIFNMNSRLEQLTQLLAARSVQPAV